MRQQPEFFANQEPKLLYIAKKLKESINLEKLLTEAGIDYGVEADNYRGGTIFPTERVGAFFYVRPETEDAARLFLSAHGLTPTTKP
jgi:hypothetical protein